MTAWTTNNELQLLENGEAFYPVIFAAIGNATSEILLETFIWEEDDTGRELSAALIAAAERGVHVHVTADGFGTPGFEAEFLAKMTDAGVIVDAYDPQPPVLWIRTNMLCRLHRKLAVIDGQIAFIGGINFGDVHLRSYGDDSMQDYAVRMRGPIVEAIHKFCAAAASNDEGFRNPRRREWRRRLKRELLEPSAEAQAVFVTRDNKVHRGDIEIVYRAGIREAKRSIVLANAYFFPGFRFVRQLCRAAERGVQVTLIMQGEPDRPLTVEAAAIVYTDLLAAGVQIYRYTERPLHAKVAVIDDQWATVGSSNLDPVSLGLNLEANIFVRDQEFNAQLRNSLQRLIDESCEQLIPAEGLRKSLVRRLILAAAYHLTLRMRSWGARIRKPGRQQLKPMTPRKDEVSIDP